MIVLEIFSYEELLEYLKISVFKLYREIESLANFLNISVL